MSGGAVSRVADFAQRTVTLTLVGWLGFQVYQIGKNVREGWVRKQETGFFTDIKKKQVEETSKDDRLDVLPNFYTKENIDDYNKSIPRFNAADKPVPK